MSPWETIQQLMSTKLGPPTVAALARGASCSARSIMDQLLDHETELKAISPGGEHLEGRAIFDWWREHEDAGLRLYSGPKLKVLPPP